jgi:formylglycine-generating enzyme required for sulfatase activity
MQKTILALLLSVCIQNAYCQVLPTITPDSAGLKRGNPKVVKAAPAVSNTQTIKFSTDEDCDILIDGDNKGHLKPNTMLRIKLHKGQYQLQVNGANAADQINETLTVDETGTERLYPINLKAATEARVAKQAELQRQLDLAKVDLVLVQGGTFEMGSNEGINYADEKPTHSVTVSSFYIARQLVTQVQWQAVMGNNPSTNQCDSCPVENISWNDAQAYCQKQSRLTGRTYRLPTEAEWEYAARGGNQGHGYTYSGSNNIDEVGWNNDISGGKSYPVSQKQPNELGLYDMTGNVWEWCSDWYDKDYYDKEYYSGNPSQNPQGPSTGSYRVMRGGSWANSPDNCRVARRNRDPPVVRYGYIGFRPVVSY